MKNDPKARLRAEMILRVRAGQITPSEAARQLGISRKTYYEWEQKGLEAMLAGLTDGRPGRPPKPKPDPEIERLRRKVSDLENRLGMMAGIHDLRDLLRDLRSTAPSTKSPTRPAQPHKKKR
ncbi:helix-turn-helix domain-containing protein [Haloferula sp. A504]|uniref:helix-turn-helix domain-containing protein n=1 Tax=Haloferula sp. A504 TaxID=3373601 RepID=UPI0031BD1158|nr:helix-turn-helix domain-containing protein [Verrucomicrobiaceae bacterium E54]